VSVLAVVASALKPYRTYNVSLDAKPEDRFVEISHDYKDDIMSAFHDLSS